MIKILFLCVNNGFLKGMGIPLGDPKRLADEPKTGKYTFGKGGAYEIVGNAVVLESFAYVMPGSIISHHSSVGFATIICSGVSIAGNTSIGSSCYIGIGATVSDHLTISNNVIVGSGSNVVSDLTIPGVYYGNPARWIRDV